MFQIDDLVFYDKAGVCRVEYIGPLDGIQGVDRNKTYYRLSLFHGKGTIYIPVETSVFMRPILTSDQVNALIDQLPSIKENACCDRNVRLLAEHYQAAFETHRCEDLLQVMKTIYSKSQNSGKRLGLVEQRYQKQAEELVYSEFSAALGIPFESVPEYIEARIARLK